MLSFGLSQTLSIPVCPSCFDLIDNEIMIDIIRVVKCEVAKPVPEADTK